MAESTLKEHLEPSTISRRPSLLDYPAGKYGKRNIHVLPRNGNARPDSRTSQTSDLSDISEDSTMLQWDEEDIEKWLVKINMAPYLELFKEHVIKSGRQLLSLTEDHLKEVGVKKLGDRLDLAYHIDELRKRAGWVSRAAFVDIPDLLHQLDAAKTKQHLELYPKRIILIRHAESAGNIDTSVYAKVPDNKLELTKKGVSQAIKAGEDLKEMLGNEMVTFYVSPFLRSRSTYKYIRQAFLDEQVLFYREDPRLREQEWGNFQDPSKVESAMKDRRKIGAFYYRFATGESGADVFDRVSTFLETLYRDMQKGGCGNNAIIVTHGLFCRLFLTRFYHWSVEKFHTLWNFGNCQIVTMELQDDGFYKLITKLRTNQDCDYYDF
ncbi:uncharacterized protein [Dysidea avara]|uniref:uncharacterized protein n=1 Tax=Dysidea avara TaxID=196820 RepID=UPI00331C0185